MRARTAVAVVLLASAAVTARAGKTNYFETFVDPVGGVAYGSPVDTRHTADSVQYIACSVSFSVVAGTRVTARVQTGYLYTYALVMLLGVAAAMTWVMAR